MKKFRHLDWSDRLCIEKCYNAGKSCFEIARLLGFAPSSKKFFRDFFALHLTIYRC